MITALVKSEEMYNYLLVSFKDEQEYTAQVMRTGAYLASLHLPNFRCDRSDKVR